MFCVLLPLLGPSSPRSACQRSSLRESFAGSAPIAATSRVAATGRSRLSHSQSFAFGSPLFGARFSFSFCLNKKILNLIFLRVSCSLTISESLSRMRVADSALLSTLCFASSRLLHRRDHPRTLVALCVCVSVCVRVCVCGPSPNAILSVHDLPKLVNYVVHSSLSIVAQKELSLTGSAIKICISSLSCLKVHRTTATATTATTH